MKHIFNRLTVIIGLLAIFVGSAFATNSFLEETQNYSVTPKGNGVVHFKIPIWAYGRVNNYRLGYGTSLWYSATYDKIPTSGVTHFMYIRSTDTQNTSDPDKNSTAEIRVKMGTIKVTKTADGGTKQINPGTDYQRVELPAQKSMDGSYQRVVFLEFDWYVPQELTTTTFYAGVDGLIYKYDANDKSALQEMNIWYCFPDRLDGADDLIAPELQSPYLYFMDEEGNPVREGKAAIPYVVYQTPKSYTTTFNSQSVTVSNRAGSIIVPTADTIQRNFKATFTVQPNSDVSTTVERSTNAIDIPAYHRIYDFAVKEGKDAQGSYTGAKTLSWTIRNPQAEDLMSTDYFEIQRAQKEDYSDAQTIQLLPMTPDSSTYTYVDETTVPAGTAVTEDSLQRYYNIDYKNYVLKSEEGEPLYSMNLQLVAKTKTQPAQPIYYRVRRASASAWDWNHPFAQQTTLQQHSYLAPLALAQPNYTLDPDFENNRKVHFNIKIDNAQITDAPIVPADCELTPEFVENKMPIDSITLNVNVTPAFHEAVSYIKFKVDNRHEVDVWNEGMQTIKLPYCRSGFLEIQIKGRWYNTYLFNGCGNDFYLEIIRLTEQKMVEMDGGLYTFILDSRDRYSGGWVYEGHADFTPNQGTKVIPAVVTDRWNEVKDTVKQMMFEKLTEKYRTTVYGRCTWDRGAKVVLTRRSIEAESEIEFIVPQDSIRRNEDGSWTAHFTDIANMACTHYTYTAQIDPSDAELRFQNPNFEAPVTINGPSLYFDEAATITSFTASQGLTDGENKRGVQLRWTASAPSVDEFILLRIPQGSSSTPDTIYRGAEVTWFDQTAVPGQHYEYTIVARYECNGRRTDNNATAIGWRTEFGEIRGVVTQTDNSGMAGVTVSLSGNGLTRSMVTGASGAFVFDSLPYDVTTGAIYTITPTSQYGIFSYNNTSSGVASVALDSKNCIASGVNFVNTSCVRLTGRVLYDMSTIPVADAYFLLNGDTIRRNGKAYLTGIDGSFELTVPKSMPCRLQVAKAGHTFKNDGWLFVTEGDTTFSLVKPLDGVRLYDRTKVRLVGRVAGGIDQQKLPPALGLGKNNLGDDLQLVLMLEGDNTAHVVHNPDDLTQDSLHFAVDNTQTIYELKRIIIRPDSKTGEYAADLFPVKYKVVQATANGYATLLNIAAGAPTLDLINAPLQTLRSDSGDLHATYNAVYDCIYRSPMEVGIVQLQAGMPQEGYGEKTLPVSNLLNLSKSVDAYTVDSLGRVNYLLEYPIFQQGRTYQFRVSVYEDYYYNNDPFSSGTDRVRLNGGKLKIYNGFKSGENTATAIYPLNEAGEANIQVEVDNLSLLATGTNALRTLDLSIEREGGSLDYQALRGFVTGNYVENGDIRAVTADIKVLDVLRDPPGSGSSCSLEKGASYKSVNPFAITLKAGINLNFKIGTAYNQSVGVVSTVSYSGVSVSAGKTNAFTLPLVASIKYNSSYSYTYSNTEKISTGSSPSFVGADADVFVGHTTEVLYGTVRAVRIIDDTTYQLRKPAIDAGYIKEIASAQTEDGAKYHFVIAKETVLGSRVGTDFAYTQGHIANKILPNLVAQRNALLTNAADSAAAQAIANAQKKAVYWNIATDESKIGLDTTTYKIIKPTNVPDFVEADKVKAINNVIVKWVSILATNEREKVVARQSGKHVGTFSVSGGTNHDYSESYSADWSVGGNMSYGTPDFGTLFKQASAGSELVGSLPVGKAIINLLNDRMKAGDNAAIIDINGVAVGAQWKTEVTPVFNIDTDIPFADHSGSESKSRKISFNIAPDSYGYTTVSVYRAPADSIFAKQIGSWKQYMNMYSNATDYKYGSFIFFQEGGSSHCPYEGEIRTKWYKPGMFVLGNATLPMENPKITLDQHSISNVPADQAAVFRVTLVNDNLNTDGRPAKGQYLSLSVEPQTNPDGAIILMDGEPLTSASTLTFFCEPGVPIVKTMQVKRGIVDDYEDLTIKLASTTCASIGTLAKFSVHFMPESSPVSISYPRDKWVMNTLSARDSIGYYLPITIDGFNVHHKNFDHIEFQYKLSTENNDAWVNACSFFANDSLYALATGNKAKIENGRITPFRFYGERDPKELNYDLRAVSFCRYGSGFVTKASPVVSGIKDTRPPVLFGKANPANGILTLEDNISLRFSEPIAGNWLDEDNNFQILGVTNTTGITQTTSPYFDGEAGHFAYTKAKRELAITDLTVDMLIKPAEKNREMVLLAHGDDVSNITFSLTADNRLKLTAMDDGEVSETKLSKPMGELSTTDFTRVIMVISFDNQTVRFYAGTMDITDEEDDYTSWLLQDEMSPFIVGAGRDSTHLYHGNMMELRIWTKALTAAEIANTHLRRLTGYEYGLLDYYPMSESKGSEMSDLATGATLYAEGISWTTPQGISLAADGEPVYLQPTLFSRNEAEDYSLLFWFRSFNNDDDSVSLFGTSIGDSTTMEIVLHEGELSYRAGEVYEAARAELNNGKWHHCALVISRTFNTGSLAIDGKKVLLFSALETGALTGTKMWLAKGLEGNIDDVCLFEQALPNELISEFGMQSPNGEEMGLINLLTFSKIKRNSANVMELVFSPENQRVFKDANGKVIEKEQILLVDDLSAQADKNNSAPVRDRGQLTRLPFTWNYQLSDLMINIKAQPREINKRTMYLTVRDVEDVNGNRLPAPVTWTVYADLNSVIWNERRHEETLYADQESHRFKMTISNTTGMTRQFTIDHLPKWITASPGQGTLEAKEEKTVTFTINAAELKIGTHQQMIYLTDDQGLAEPLLLEITKETEPPYTNVDLNKYPFNMSLCGRVMIEENGKTVINTDEEDFVYAIYNNECVGVAHCTNRGELYLTIHGSEAMMHKSIRFQLWKAATGKVYNLIPDHEITFAHGFVFGCGNEQPVVLTAGGSEMQTISLNKGWNWISTYLQVPSSLQTAITAEQPWAEGDLIKNPATRQFCTYSEQTDNFVGTLSKIHFSHMYMVYNASANNMHIFGDELSQDSMQIILRGDGHWSELPCLYEQVISLREAMGDYYSYASPGDIIKSHNHFATFSTDKRWVGDLTSLTPGEGYLFRRMGSGSVAINFYKYRYSAPKKVALPYNEESEVGFHASSATNMTMIATIGGLVDERVSGLEVYIDDQLVGKAKPIDSMYFLTIQSDAIGGTLRFVTEDGQELTIVNNEQMSNVHTAKQIVRPEEDKKSQISNDVIHYVPDSHLGSLESPVILTPFLSEEGRGEASPYKLLEDDHVVIIRNGEKYDVTGKKLR